MKPMKRLLSIVLAIATVLVCILPASAASASTQKLPSLSSSAYIKTYTSAATGKVYAYIDATLKTKKSGYWIDCATDECYIVAVSNNAIKVSYPIGGGKRSTQWFRRSDFTNTSLSGALTVKTTTAKITAYTRSNGKTSYGYAGKGDLIYILARSGNYTQIIYPLTTKGQWKMAWVKTSDLSKSVKASALSSCTITVSSVTYNGKAQKPKVTVKDGSLTLTEGTDYTLTYSNNTNAGTGKVTVKGKGSYTGSVTKTFTINKASNTISASNVTKQSSSSKQTGSLNAKANGGAALTYSSSNTALVTVDSKGRYTINANKTGSATITITAKGTANYKETTKKVTITVKDFRISNCSISVASATYTGSALKPKVTVKSGSSTLKEGTDYTLTYSNNTNAGTGKVTIKGKGSYTGSITKTFTINKASNTITASDVTKTKSSSKQTGNLNAKANGGAALTYSSSNTALVTVDSKGKYTINANKTGTAKITITAAATSNYKKTTKTVSITVSDYEIVSSSKIEEAAKKYNISSESNAYKALESINTTYGKELYSSKNKTLVFLFEGVGSSSKVSDHMNAMCVVVKEGEIVYINRNCSTIPDYPFDPSKNAGTDMPTLRDGIYNFSTVNHHGEYAALNVSSAKVVRFKSTNSFYSSTSSAINVHRCGSPRIYASSPNSAGCQLIGKKSTSGYAFQEYLDFAKAVGIIKKSATTVTKYNTSVSGKIIIDRTYAESYLTAVGYSSKAISLIRGK